MNEENEKGLTEGIIMLGAAAITIVIMLPMLNPMIQATPVMLSGPFNTTQTQISNTAGIVFDVMLSLATLMAIAFVFAMIYRFIHSTNNDQPDVNESTEWD